MEQEKLNLVIIDKLNENVFSISYDKKRSIKD